jgi:GT2 family glycosyltransferase
VEDHRSSAEGEGLSSIIIPVHNRVALTQQCIDTIFREPPGVPFEVIVVDDGSTDSMQELLAGYGDKVKVVRREAASGFATACNDGAAAASGDYLVFLNNDTIPQPGWLDALVDYAERHSRAGVVGSKLLYPDGTVQHAGVIISQEGFPRHIYTGFPGDHPAVNKSRQFVAVTFASALVRRNLFEQVGRLDTAFRNSTEDVDLCFRLQERGHEVHYCHESVVHHLESVSRGRRSEHDRYNAKLLRDRWADRLVPNDFEYYIADGLLRVSHQEAYPLRWEISPRLALQSGPGSVEATTRLLAERSREVFKLLKETIRLTARVAELELRAGGQAKRAETPPPEQPAAPPEITEEELFARVHGIELEIYNLQRQLENLLRDTRPGNEGERFTRSDDLAQLERMQRFRELVNSAVPEDAAIFIVSGGDPELVHLNGCKGKHFPEGEKGSDMAIDPDGGAAVIEHLEELRTKGAEYLVFPVTGLWWLDRYPEFRRHLEERYQRIVDEDDACVIFSLA